MERSRYRWVEPALDVVSFAALMAMVIVIGSLAATGLCLLLGVGRG